MSVRPTLLIRDEQMRMFAEVELHKFERQMTADLARRFPARTRAAGPAAVAQLVRHGVARAAAYGIRAKQDVALYLGFCVRFGQDFDKDPRLPWASRILGKQQDATSRMRTLVRASRRTGRA
jgi:hypothetical protein